MTDRLRRLARDWRVKVAVQNAIGLLPGSWGFRANEALVRRVRGGAAERFDPVARALKGLDNLDLLAAETGFSAAGAAVLEWGTGWSGVDLLLFHALGAERIVTVDHHQHLTLEWLRRSAEALADPAVRERLMALGGDPARIDATSRAVRAPDLGIALERLGVRLVLAADCDLSRTDAAPDFHLFWSESVLHRIRRKSLPRSLAATVRRLAPGAAFFHRTDQNDINGQAHTDSALWRLAYLRWPDAVFETVLSTRFNCQNRMRESDFLTVLDAVGLRATFVESHVSRSDFARLEGYPLARRFRGRPLREVAIAHSRIVGRCAEAPPRLRRVWVESP